MGFDGVRALTVAKKLSKKYEQQFAVYIEDERRLFSNSHTGLLGDLGIRVIHLVQRLDVIAGEPERHRHDVRVALLPEAGENLARLRGKSVQKQNTKGKHKWVVAEKH